MRGLLILKNNKYNYTMKIIELKQEHPLIYNRALECQVQQGNKKNDKLKIEETLHNGNFSWCNTKEGFDIWCKVKNLDFEPFYKFYKLNTIENSVFCKIRLWANERGLIENGDVKTQAIKLVEEVGELSRAIIKSNEEDFIDAIGDCVVVLTNLAAIKDLKIEDCIDKAYNVIKDRKGKMENGSFIKD